MEISYHFRISSNKSSWMQKYASTLAAYIKRSNNLQIQLADIMLYIKLVVQNVQVLSLQINNNYTKRAFATSLFN